MRFLNTSNLIIKVNFPTENEINTIKDNSILIGMMNPNKNKNHLKKIIG